ncbi:MAG: PAS domain-containing protein [Nanoarchaeota archaeon]|nr:PAS domain-containing protein [Nanoarchaeota archaeon]MBU1103526.1 PAS domain-containing protein [Nanoarchaeota archaeon]
MNWDEFLIKPMQRSLVYLGKHYPKLMRVMKVIPDSFLQQHETYLGVVGGRDSYREKVAALKNNLRRSGEENAELVRGVNEGDRQIRHLEAELGKYAGLEARLEKYKEQIGDFRAALGQQRNLNAMQKKALSKLRLERAIGVARDSVYSEPGRFGVAVDYRGVIIGVSERALKRIGYPEKELIGRNANEFILGDYGLGGLLDKASGEQRRRMLLQGVTIASPDKNRKIVRDLVVQVHYSEDEGRRVYAAASIKEQGRHEKKVLARLGRMRVAKEKRQADGEAKLAIRRVDGWMSDLADLLRKRKPLAE